MSSTALSSPALAETLTYDPDNQSHSAYGNDTAENPYQQRREKLKAAQATALPSPDLLKEAPVRTAKIQPVAPPKAEPMKITIPNLRAMEEAKTPPTLLAQHNEHTYTPPPTALPLPGALAAAPEERKPFTSDPDRQTVAAFKPLPSLPQKQEQVPSEPPAARSIAASNSEPPQNTASLQAAPKPSAPDVERQTVAAFAPLPPAQAQASAQSFAALSPAAGPDTPPNTAPLIAVPDSAPPPAAPAIPPVAPATPPAPAAATPPPDAPPPADASNATANTTTTQTLDNALQEPVINVPETDARSEVQGSLPSLEPKGKESNDSKQSKKKKSKEKEVKEVKPYSPLDSEPPQGLSKESEAALNRLPSNIGKQKAKPTGPFNIERTKDMGQEFKTETPTESGTVTHEAMGIKIAVSKPAVNLDYELEKAYDALVTGQPTMAIQIYKNILENDPNNKGALFGLATTFHRSGQLDQARVYYAKLLSIDPNHRDGLNNFLVLLSDEAPEEALEQMGKLEARNPDFSPIPAQMAVIYQRLGNTDKATEKMFRAIELAPENLVYRYNLAIMLDRQKKYDEAAKLYKQLIQSAMRGETIPGNLQKIQQRLTFIGSNRR